MRFEGRASQQGTATARFATAGGRDERGARLRTTALGVTVALVVLAGSLILPTAADAATKTYFFSGNEVHIDVPAWVQSIDVTATGAASEDVGSVRGGRGAEVSGTLNVGPGCIGTDRCEDLYVEVGDVGKCNGAGGGASSPTGPA